MDGMEEKLGSILGNPELMQKIMSMAQSLNPGSPPEPQQPPPETSETPSIPNIDLTMIQSLSGLMGRANIDRQQQALLTALRPYLNSGRIRKLENAMRAAKMAGFAALALRQQGPLSFPGR